MRPFIALLLCAFASFADDVVFRGTPSVRLFASIDSETREKLDAEAAKKSECVIVLRKNKYYWASRDNAQMTRIDAPQFTYFVHQGGAGYVKVFTGERNAAKAPADYIENITNGFEVITYWGRVTSAPAAEPAK
jgi:hypothetical protein